MILLNFSDTPDDKENMMTNLKLIHGDAQILEEPFTGPTVELTVYHQFVDKEFVLISKAWGLDYTDTPDGINLKCSSQKSGEHKLQALTLFYAFLEIHSKNPNAKCVLRVVDTLKALINPSLKTSLPLMNDPHPLCLDASVSFILNEIEIPVGEPTWEFNFVSKDVLGKIRESILQNANHTIRKSA